MAASAIEAGSMRDAAGRFAVSPSAISQAVRKAEEHFGAKLLHRDVRPLMPTAAGQALLSEMQSLDVILDGIAGKVRAAAAASGAVDLRIGLVDTVAGTIAARIFRHMGAARPALRLTGVSGLSSELGEALSRRRIDVAITCDPAERAGFEVRPILIEHYVLLVQGSAVAAIEGRGLREILDAHVLVRHSQRSYVGAQVDQHLRKADIAARRVFEFDMSDAIVAMVANGAGVAITTPLCILQGLAHIEGVSVLPLPGPGLARQLLVASRRGEFEVYANELAAVAQNILLAELSRRFAGLAPGIFGKA
ncbi:LysR family transcriptional regulator [Aurantimonas aggregata]|uniref:LysR family transcriptional regulator n=1 Tax=Aurantimonas aggregata TaxID=2047720 RepID=A0A6L9MJ26_9HYPH|nr:LysR family transcriptional regulator [Aurantimonas aggregata]NDV87656.1 LysR family transcriptional regulator [Aurantimonas aggregata]